MKFKVAFILANVCFATSLASTPLPFDSSELRTHELSEDTPKIEPLAISQNKNKNRDRNPDHYCRRPNASCVQLACFYDHCDMDSRLEKVTEACHGVWDDGCIRALCNRRGDCSFLSRFLKYTELCGNKN